MRQKLPKYFGNVSNSVLVAYVLIVLFIFIYPELLKRLRQTVYNFQYQNQIWRNMTQTRHKNTKICSYKNLRMFYSLSTKFIIFISFLAKIFLPVYAFTQKWKNFVSITLTLLLVGSYLPVYIARCWSQGRKYWAVLDI